MQITMEPTAEIVAINGELSRIWRGTDEQGVPVEVFVRMVSPQTHDTEVNDRYARELREVGGVIDFRSII